MFLSQRWMTPELLSEDPLEEARQKVSRLPSHGGGLMSDLLVLGDGQFMFAGNILILHDKEKY